MKRIKIKLSWVFFGVVGFLLIKSFFNPNLEISLCDKDLSTALANGMVDKVVYVRNTGMVYINMKKEGMLVLLSKILKKNKDIEPSFKDKILQFFGVKRNISISMMVPSVEVFDQNFKTAQQNIPDDKKIGYEVVEKVSLLGNIMRLFSFFFTILFAYYIMIQIGMMRGEKGGIGSIFGLGKSNAKLFDKDSNGKVTFKDVAGMAEVKQELQEIIDFLKNKKLVSKIGGNIPRGVLLSGSPGNGKTLLARAVAGEANVPFFFMSGSDFGSMFYGVAPARVRNVFAKAKEVAPAIIFIDEIDSIGKQRGRKFSVNDEQENTLNTLLTEMDGFEKNSGIILIAATNRPELLDQALLRPGRFDRKIIVDMPTIKDREAIFKLYIKKIKVDDKINIKRLAEQTSGFSAAEIANICNEAALFAIRKKHEKIVGEDFQEAIDRVILGVEKKSRIPSKEEKEIISYHEAGHTVVSWFLQHAHPLLKVTIIPRGVALGYAQYTPKEQVLQKKEEMIDEICSFLGGRIAEEIFFSTQSSGAVNDLERVCDMAYNMVTIYGMNDKIGAISFSKYFREKNGFEQKPYSDKTAEIIDDEVKKLVEDCYNRSKQLLLDKKDKVEDLAKELLQKEVIYKDDVEKIIGERPFNTTNHE